MSLNFTIFILLPGSDGYRSDSSKYFTNIILEHRLEIYEIPKSAPKMFKSLKVRETKKWQNNTRRIVTFAR